MLQLSVPSNYRCVAWPIFAGKWLAGSSRLPTGARRGRPVKQVGRRASCRRPRWAVWAWKLFGLPLCRRVVQRLAGRLNHTSGTRDRRMALGGYHTG
jgi:hypothetical protein